MDMCDLPISKLPCCKFLSRPSFEFLSTHDGETLAPRVGGRECMWSASDVQAGRRVISTRSCDATVYSEAGSAKFSILVGKKSETGFRSITFDDGSLCSVRFYLGACLMDV